MKKTILASIIAGALNAALSFALYHPAQLMVTLGKAFLMGAVITWAAIKIAEEFGE